VNDADRTTLAVAAGVTAFAIVYLCAAFLEWPLLTYFPERGAWRFVAHAPPQAIPYYGLVLWGLLAGVDVGTVVYVGAGVVARRPLSRRLGALWTGWTLVALILAAAYFTFRAVT
jgi:hypothetical protein